MSDKRKTNQFEIANQRNREARDAANAAQYEEKLVNVLLSAFKLSRFGPKLRSVHHRLTGHHRLTLANFNEMFNDFPILLSYSTVGDGKLHLDPNCFMPVLFSAKCVHAPFIKEYDLIRYQAERVAGGRAVGMVFRRKGVSNGLLLHNGNAESRWIEGGYFTFRTTVNEVQRVYCLQPFGTLIKAMATGEDAWRPGYVNES